MDALQLAHVVKYSHGRRKSFDEWLSTGKPLLEIETLGRGGLRYRSRLQNPSKSRWHQLSAPEVSDVRDTVGAGDWCTAGILFKLCASGAQGLSGRSDEEVEQALAFGQALAAWNCGYEGARGGMYHVTREELLEVAHDLLVGEGSPVLAPMDDEPPPAVARICAFCKPSRKPSSKPKKAPKTRQRSKSSRG
jgi:fructokinase